VTQQRHAACFAVPSRWEPPGRSDGFPVSRTTCASASRCHRFSAGQPPDRQRTLRDPTRHPQQRKQQPPPPRNQRHTTTPGGPGRPCPRRSRLDAPDVVRLIREPRRHDGLPAPFPARVDPLLPAPSRKGHREDDEADGKDGRRETLGVQHPPRINRIQNSDP